MPVTQYGSTAPNAKVMPRSSQNAAVVNRRGFELVEEGADAGDGRGARR